MKHIKQSVWIVVASLLTFSGCVTLNKYSMDSYDIDLTQFEKEGIFVTTGDCFQKYKSISILSSECYHGYVPKGDSKKQNRKDMPEDDLYVSSSPTENRKNFEFKRCKFADLFSEMISEAKQLGANGIIRIEIRPVSREGESKNPEVIQRGIMITGLAVNID